MKLFGYKIVDAEIYDVMVDADGKTRHEISVLKERLSDMTANADACKSDLNINKNALRTANSTAEDNMKMLKEAAIERDAANSYIIQLEGEIKMLKDNKKSVAKTSGKRTATPAKKSRGGKKK